MIGQDGELWWDWDSLDGSGRTNREAMADLIGKERTVKMERHQLSVDELKEVLDELK
jgi:hypothetical protein